MSKAIIYDTDKQEYVTAVNRRLVSGDIDYLTSKDVEEAQVVDSDVGVYSHFGSQNS